MGLAGLAPDELDALVTARYGAAARTGVVATDLAHAPAQAADLLATAAEQAAALPPGPDRTRLQDRIAVARTGVLAEAGHMAEAMQVVEGRGWPAPSTRPCAPTSSGSGCTTS